jgi:hypothetical protein
MEAAAVVDLAAMAKQRTQAKVAMEEQAQEAVRSLSIV